MGTGTLDGEEYDVLVTDGGEVLRTDRIVIEHEITVSRVRADTDALGYGLAPYGEAAYGA